MSRSSWLRLAVALLALMFVSTDASAASVGWGSGAKGSASAQILDAGQIVYRAGVAHSTAIMRIDADGTDKIRLTDPRTSYVESPRWSPDGTKIAFSGRRLGRSPDIWVMNSDGSGRQRLTRTPDAYDWAPAWSPDGTQIVWRHDGRPHGSQLAIMNSDGTNAHALFSPRRGNPLPNFDWSPDGTQIVFTLCVHSICDMYSIAPDGAGLRRLTDTPEREFYPRWSPDGSTILFTSASGEGLESNVRLLDPVTLDVTTVLDDPDFYEFAAAFSPAGNRLVWTRITPSSWSIELVISDLDGQNLTVVVPCKREYCYLEDPDWTA